MSNYIRYEEIPDSEQRLLTKHVFKENRTVRLWSALTGGIGVGMGMAVADNSFPDKSDWPGKMILGALFSAGLTALFFEAVVKPKIIRLVEKQKNS